METTLNTLHPTIVAALRGHGKADPFTLAWLLGRCKKINPDFPPTEIQMAELRQHVTPSPTSKTPDGETMYTKGPKFKA